MKKVRYKNKEGIYLGRVYKRDGGSLALVRFFGNKTASRIPFEKLESPVKIEKEKPLVYEPLYYSKY